MIPEQMSKRMTVTLPDSVYADLEWWSENRGQAVAPLAAIAIERAIQEAKDSGEVPPRKVKGEK